LFRNSGKVTIRQGGPVPDLAGLEDFGRHQIKHGVRFDALMM
jgi:hypothetical protein